MSGNGGEVCVGMRMIDVCCLQVIWRGQGARTLGMKGKIYKLRLSGK